MLYQRCFFVPPCARSTETAKQAGMLLSFPKLSRERVRLSLRFSC